MPNLLGNFELTMKVFFQVAFWIFRYLHDNEILWRVAFLEHVNVCSLAFSAQLEFEARVCLIELRPVSFVRFHDSRIKVC